MVYGRFHPKHQNVCYVTTGGGKVEMCDYATGDQKVVVDGEAYSHMCIYLSFSVVFLRASSLNKTP